MTPKGYTARIEFDQRDNIFTGKIIGIADNITIQEETVKELRDNFQAAIDHYLRISFTFLLSLALTWGLCFFFSAPAAAQKIIPNVVGMTLDQAKKALAEAGVTSIEYYSRRPTNDNSQDQKVYAQTPAPGQPIAGMVVLEYYRR